MEIIEILLIVIIIIIAIKIAGFFADPLMAPKRKSNYTGHHNDQPIFHIDDILDETPHAQLSPQASTLNPYLNNVKFHTDYRDVITAFGDLVPSQKQIFNITNIPVKVTDIEYSKKIRYIISDFIDTLNDNITNNLTGTHSWFRGANTGWDEPLPDPQIQSGWDKQQKVLGLPTSLYKNPATPAQVKLVQVMRITKYESDIETKYLIQLVIQKENTADQLLLKASFIQNKEVQSNNQLIIEELDITGFLSKYGEQADRFNAHDNYYNFDSLEKTNMISDKNIVSELLKKNTQKLNEVQYRISMLNEEDREHYNIPNLSQYNAYKNTTTIFDDMKGLRF